MLVVVGPVTTKLTDYVRMIQRRERLGLLCEPRHAFVVRCERVGQDLDRNLAAQRGVRCPIHLPHAAFAAAR